MLRRGGKRPGLRGGGDQAFGFIGTAAFSSTAGELRYATAQGNALVVGDVNGDGTPDFAILVKDVTNLTAGEFVL